MLLNVRDESAQVVRGHLADVDAVYEDAATLGIVESHQQVHDRRLARTGVSDERESLSRPRGESRPPLSTHSGSVGVPVNSLATCPML